MTRSWADWSPRASITTGGTRCANPRRTVWGLRSSTRPPRPPSIWEPPWPPGPGGRAGKQPAGRAVPCAAMVDALQRPRAAVPEGRGRRPARGFGLALAGVVLLGLLLRVWGIRWGLPFAYNLDERSHFVPRAVGFFRDGSLDPDYQLNPSGLMELVAAALLVTRGSSGAIVRAWQDDPAQVWTVARVAAALVSTAAIPLLYVAGR